MAGTPVVITAAGLLPQDPAALRAQVVAYAAKESPGYTDNLPGSLVEDICSTDVGALVVCDQAKVDLVNSLNPRTANQQLLFQLGAIYGVAQGQDTNASVAVVFSGPPGLVVPQGFVVSDGAHQYATGSAVVIGGGGQSQAVAAIATASGSWSIGSGTVTQLVTSPPPGVTLTVNNPLQGQPGGATQSEGDYRAQVLQAGLASAQGTPRLLRKLLADVPGVDPRLISIRQATTGTWEVIVGGTGDPYLVAGAIYSALFEVASLAGSSTASRNVSVQLSDYPDTYTITFVAPPQQTVGLQATWNTSSPNYVSAAAVAQAAQPALVDYVNSIPVGQPLNLLQAQAVFQQAVASIVPPELLSKLVFSVTVNGSAATPETGTQLIPGDPESYFMTNSSDVTVVQG